MVEAVDREGAAAPIEDGGDCLLYAFALDLDEQRRAVAYEVTGLGERRDVRAGDGRPMRGVQLAPQRGRDLPAGARNGIVVYHHYPIGRGVDVELDALRPRREGGGEGGERVLALPARHPAVGDSEWRAGHRDRPGGGRGRAGGFW